jgi:hypothetical protein
MSFVTQLYFQIVEEISYMFRPFPGWAIIRLRLEYRRKHIYYNVDIKNRGTRSRFTMFGEVRSYRVYTRCEICARYDFICRVFCGFIDTWAAVVFGSCFGNRWSVRSWLGRLHRWWVVSFLCASYVVIQVCFVIYTCSSWLCTLAQL